MSRMIDLIRASAVPANLVQSAAKGSLSVPAGEMIEILVHLAVHNRVFSEQAQLTLAGWDEAASRTAASDSKTPKEVLDYLISPKNLRPVLLPALLANPSVSDEALLELAPKASRDSVEIMLKSDRINQSVEILKALLSNLNLTGIQSETIRNKIEPPAPEVSQPEVKTSVAESEPAGAPDEEVFQSAPGDEVQEADTVLDEGVLAYMKEHEGEIAAEADHAFQPIGGIHEEVSTIDAATAQVAVASTGSTAGAAARKAPAKTGQPLPEQRGSALQKISRLDIKGRIQLAMKGSKEERSLLIRDGTKIVALAVLESPKISDGEVERFATQKNVLEAVLRGIPMKRRFAKNYNIIRNLVFNPRTPLDLSLGLMKNMMIGDLRALAGNKEISDTVRKLATKMFRQKMDVNKR
jgi:hypothetical protein